MKIRRTLIRPPLEWQMTAAPLPHPALPVLAERGGTQLKTPRPVILVVTRGQNPFDFSRFDGWFAGIEKKPLKLGDYSLAGLEDVCVVERKDLPDLIHSLSAERSVFVNRLRRMSRYPHRLLVITAALSQVKSPSPYGGWTRIVSPSPSLRSLPGFRFPFLCTETHELGEELAASYLYQVHLYHWLETNNHGRFLTDNDL
jgi:hypothetical protein